MITVPVNLYIKKHPMDFLCCEKPANTHANMTSVMLNSFFLVMAFLMIIWNIIRMIMVGIGFITPGIKLSLSLY